MKIYNTIEYNEKLKIRPANIHNMERHVKIEFNYEFINPKTIWYDVLENGWIVRTNGPGYDPADDCNIWIVFDKEHTKAITEKKYSRQVNVLTSALVKPNHMEIITYLDLDVYKNSWPDVFNYTQFNITGVWKTDIDIDQFRYRNDLVEFYNEANLKIKFNNENI